MAAPRDCRRGRAVVICAGHHEQRAPEGDHGSRSQVHEFTSIHVGLSFRTRACAPIQVNAVTRTKYSENGCRTRRPFSALVGGACRQARRQITDPMATCLRCRCATAATGRGRGPARRSCGKVGFVLRLDRYADRAPDAVGPLVRLAEVPRGHQDAIGARAARLVVVGGRDGSAGTSRLVTTERACEGGQKRHRAGQTEGLPTGLTRPAKYVGRSR